MAVASFDSSQGRPILLALVSVIQENKQYLSDIDGQIGDGDHGINMAKGFTLFADQIDDGSPTEPLILSDGLRGLSKVLMTKIGGSMGPLYGMFFRSMAKACDEVEKIDVLVFGDMLSAGKDGISGISKAQPGDKTLMDTLVPALEAFLDCREEGRDFAACLHVMSAAARKGRDATKDLISKVGRSSRLGERSRGVIDAGAASCCLILETMAGSIAGLLR